MSIELPGPLEPLDIPIPELARTVFSTIKTYTYTDDQIMVLAARFSGSGRSWTQAELKAFAAGFLNSIRNEENISDVKTSTQMQNESAILMKQTHKANGIAVDSRCWLQIKGRTFFLVALRFLENDEGTRSLAMQILNSVETE
jgi:hypothetical protein